MKRVILYTIAALVIAFIGWRAFVMNQEVTTGPAKRQFELGYDAGKHVVSTATGRLKMPPMAEIDDLAQRSMREQSSSPSAVAAYTEGFRKGFVEEYNYRFKSAQ